MNQVNGRWLDQKLIQNGFSVQDLADQCGLSAKTITKIIETDEADEADWDLILDTLNQYPAIMLPSSEILKDLAADTEKFGEDGACVVYYGVNQNQLGFCCYQNLGDGTMHGANVSTEFLAELNLTLKEASELFFKQSCSMKKFDERGF